MSSIRTLVADDHAPFRSGLVSLLGLIPDVDVVGEASDGAEVVRRASAVQPDVILMDLQMPVLDGIEATRRIARTSPHIGILVLTMFDDDASVFSAMKAGARGYVLKGADRSEIERALRAVHSGEAIFTAPIARRFIHYFTGAESRARDATFPQLTQREREVLDLISQGCTNATIAHRLTLSPKTVRNHVSHVFAKLQVADRAQAVVRARDAGWGSTPAAGTSDRPS